MDIKARLPAELQTRFIRETASNIYLAKPLMKHFLALDETQILSHFDDDVSQLQEFGFAMKI